jgi:hypothetical protein
MNEAEMITLTFIDDYLQQNFELVTATTYDSLVGSRTAFSPDFTELDYIASARFGQTSEYVPPTSELDLLVEIALSQPQVQTLLIMLRNLPQDNPYSKTSEVTYKRDTNKSSEKSSSGMSTGGIVGVTSAFLFTFIITGAAFAHRCGLLNPCREYKRAPQADIKSKDIEVLSNCTSSVESPSTRLDGDDYRSRIIDEDEDIEITFETSSQEEHSHDPLFEAPFTRYERRRQDHV